MNELALFAGAGGGILGGRLLGWRTVCAVEWEQSAASILAARQNDGSLETFPIWSDVCTFDGNPWRGIVDVVSGGFPCQDISAAGKGAGIDGERSGLWSEMARIVGEVRPKFVWVENSPMLISRGLALVISDLAKMGYASRWGIVGADDANSPHQRKRCWVLAYSDSYRLEKERNNKLLCKQTNNKGHTGHVASVRRQTLPVWSEKPQTETSYCGVADGLANRMDRLKAAGNGQCPQSMEIAFKLLSGETE